MCIRLFEVCKGLTCVSTVSNGLTMHGKREAKRLLRVKSPKVKIIKQIKSDMESKTWSPDMESKEDFEEMFLVTDNR